MKQSSGRYRSVIVFVVVALLVVLETGCTSSTPSPTLTSSPTPVPSLTPSPSPTLTPTPKPGLDNLLVATNDKMTGAQGWNGELDAGPQAIFVSFDHAAIPSDATVALRLERGNVTVLEREQPWAGDSTGTTVLSLVDDPRLMSPGAYNITLQLAGQRLVGRYRISATKGRPGTQLLADPFDDNLLDWEEFYRSASESKVEDGVLRVRTREEQYFDYSTLPIEFEDFDISVDARREEGPRDGYYGIAFRVSRTGSYLFLVTADGYMEVGRFTSDDYTPLVKYARSDAIKRGDETNRLHVVAKGSAFVFYINDQQVAALRDDAIGGGFVGLASGTYNDTDMIAVFDNVEISLPPADMPLPPTSTPTPQVTLAPRATRTPTQPPTPPLLDTITSIRTHIDNIGGALDRLYHGSGVEACAPLLADYYAVVNAPVYDVSSQPGKVQGAYDMYRQGVALIVDKISKIRDVCERGGGTLSPLDFDLSRIAIGDASNLLGTAIGLLVNP